MNVTNNFRAGSLLILQIAFAVTCALRSSAVTDRDIYRIFRQRGIPFNSNVARKFAVEGMLRATDPRAKIISTEEAEKLVRDETIEKAEEWPEGICYLKLKGIYDDGWSEIGRHLQAWSEAGRSGVIIDMRGAGGNSLASVDKIVGMFTTESAVLYRVKNGRGRIVQIHQAVRNLTLPARLPLMLVVDKETTDASEVLASAMKGRDGVMLVGSRTSGIMGLRQVIPLSNSEMIYVATRWIVPPEGAEYDSTGVRPDIVVSEAGDDKLMPMALEKKGEHKQLSDKAKLGRELMQKVAGDAALGRVTDILLGLKALGVYDYGIETATNTASSARQ